MITVARADRNAKSRDRKARSLELLGAPTVAAPEDFDGILFSALAAVGVEQTTAIERRTVGRHTIQLLLSGTVDGQAMTPYALTIQLDGSAARYGFGEVGPVPIQQ